MNSENTAISELKSKDFMEVDALKALQLSKLQNIARHAFENVEFYRRKFTELSVTPDDIKSLDDIKKLPFTVKTDLRDNYPFALFAVPRSEVIRVHASSGTTGKPIVVGYNQHDIDVWKEVIARSFISCGLDNNDIIQVSYGYGLFTGGLGAHYGAEALGAMTVPTSVGNTDRQIMLMKDFGTTAMCCTPSYFTFLIEKAQQMGIDLRELPIKAGIFGAEPWTPAMREQIEKNAGIKAFDIYGLSEIIGPGVAIECECQQGLHVFEDHFYPEIINPETLEVLPDGEWGELVLTTLSKEAMPMIRYRTRDLTRIIPEKCACGRTIRRIDRISSRSDDMMIIKGVNIFPSQIEAALLAVDGTLPHYNIILFKDKGMDNIEVAVEVRPELFSDKVRAMEDLQKKLTHSIESVTGLHIKVKLVAPNTIIRSEGKAKRVIDHRFLNS